jgi:hypothetical protein
VIDRCDHAGIRGSSWLRRFMGQAYRGWTPCRYPRARR